MVSLITPSKKREVTGNNENEFMEFGISSKESKELQSISTIIGMSYSGVGRILKKTKIYEIQLLQNVKDFCWASE